MRVTRCAPRYFLIATWFGPYGCAFYVIFIYYTTFSLHRSGRYQRTLFDNGLDPGVTIFTNITCKKFGEKSQSGNARFNGDDNAKQKHRGTLGVSRAASSRS